MADRTTERRRPPGTPLRNFRAEDELWDAAIETAKRLGENLSTDVLRPALVDYVERNKVTPASA